MNVRDLTYRVVNPQEYAHEDLVEHVDPVGAFTLTKGLLRVELYVPETTVLAARACVDPVVRCWVSLIRT